MAATACDDAVEQLARLLNQANVFSLVWILAEEEPLKKTFEGYPTETLVRFLKAREWNVNKAQRMLIDSLNWRIQNEIDSILEKPIIPVELYRSIRETQLVGLSGYSKEGIPVFACGVGLSTYDKASVNYYVQSHIQINEYRDRIILQLDLELKELRHKLRKFLAAAEKKEAAKHAGVLVQDVMVVPTAPTPSTLLFSSTPTPPLPTMEQKSLNDLTLRELVQLLKTRLEVGEDKHHPTTEIEVDEVLTSELQITEDVHELQIDDVGCSIEGNGHQIEEGEDPEVVPLQRKKTKKRKPMVTKKFGRPISTCIKVLDMTGLKLSALNQMKVVKPLLQERTRKKVHVLRGCGRDELLKIMDQSSLPHFCREGAGSSKHSSSDKDNCFSLDHPFHQELYHFIEEQALNQELIKQGSLHVKIPEQDPADAKIVEVIEAEFHKLGEQNGCANGDAKE
ncbi:hypothetical protein PR202_gb27858 [Eleusine coracana subsp. coracana]|uniref:CRAL/TRIO N-terminal domain-containing protein n=1 Tax=Eleusine coracana subsp. coracana TaxID=191504 RepID=A0AAV5FVX5_ELECO|nr:hypothetical protein PR202_gb27858 [Eleusine coracana subsp. coracana]